jgi:hypothetical protein
MVTCKVVRLDDELPRGVEVSLIKCDVEGAELFAFRGGEQTIDRDLPSVIAEINPWYLEGFGVSTADLLEFFSRRGYQMYWFDDKAKRLLPRSLDDVVEDNYIFIHPRRRDRFASLLG